MDEWVIRVRNANREMIGEIDDEQELEIRDRHLAHGAWKIVVDADTDSAALLEEGNGIAFEVNGRTVFSGPTAWSPKSPMTTRAPAARTAPKPRRSPASATRPRSG
ncbi:hypothetical protein [Nocardiopsis sp. YSL2]|uniref:hypothetical protein n=1 Tax=Nocardiopsis sp. YSL2 TaxID=2939492 RepID=UPI0026F4372C|nr:hypothetical protein [Nocardiopsis sp. YSL2]